MTLRRALRWLVPASLLVAVSTVLAGGAANAPSGSTAGTAPAVDYARSDHASANGPDVRSSAALVLDVTHSSVLYSRDADRPRPIASITKLMTALVVLDAALPLEEPITISPADQAHAKGVYSRLAVGTTLARADLLHLALMSSENRAAHALARTYPGGVTAFVRAMNAKARALGMTHTHFVGPSGLSSGNVASPRDLVRLVEAAAANPIIREYSTDDRHTFKVGGQMLEYRNTNTLVARPDWNIVVQKTGYISEAGRCLVMEAVFDGRTVVMVLLNSFGKYTRVADARRVRKWMESLPPAPEARASSAPAAATAVHTGF